MKALAVLLVGLLLASCSGLEPLDAPLAERVEFESVDLPGRLWDPFMPSLEDGEPLMVSGLLTIPATDSPVPAVIITHGCGGVGGAETNWVDNLARAGIATFVVDSFRGRGISNICTGRETLNVASPIIDVYRAAEQLDGHPYIDGSRLAVMGFSFGGRAAIWSGFTRFQNMYGGRAFAGYVAFYPSTCYIELAEEEISGGPLRIFHGTEDNWTPIDQCQDMIQRFVSKGIDAALYPYPGAEHSFDDPGLAWAVRHLSLEAVSPGNCSFIEVDGAIIDPDTGDVAGVGSSCVERGVNYAYNAEARERARADLASFLQSVFDR